MAFCPPSPALQALPRALRAFYIGLFLAVAALHDQYRRQVPRWL
jgi:hypothetical protein